MWSSDKMYQSYTKTTFFKWTIWNTAHKFDIYYLAIWCLDKNILKLPWYIFRVAIFLFDYQVLPYCQNSNATPFDLVIPRIVYYVSLNVNSSRKTISIDIRK